MEKMRMESVDMTAQNVEKIGALFPNCVTETVGEDGNLKKAINFEMLKQMLSDDVLEGDEAYEFTWVGKKAAIVEANKPIRKTLRPCPEESKDWDTTENLYIEGDNLEVLKLMQESYLGGVKLIYIDPPYNTGHDFIYPDSFIMDNEEYNEGTGYFDEDGNVNFSRENGSTAGKYHSDWCSMMYSRLLLARNLLTDDGVIFISIDDNELENLMKIGNEIFGEENLSCNLVWQKKTGASDAKGIATITENILVYVKNNNLFAESFSKNTASYDVNRYKYSDKYVKERGPYYIDNLDRGGLSYSDSLNYGIECPDGTIAFPNGRTEYYNDGWIWKWSKEKIEWARKNDFLEFRKTEKKANGWSVCYKNYLNVNNENKPIEKAAPHKNLINDVINANAASIMKTLFGTNNYFSYSKPVELLKKLVSFIKGNDYLVLDFFSGSATTAHAVMQKNAEDGGHRKFIMVQLPEPCGEKTTAYKAGYATICDIGKERIRRAGEKIKEEHPDVDTDLDVGFRVLKLDDSNMKDVYYSADALNQANLFDMVSNIKEDRNDLDLLFGCLLDWGLPLSLPYHSETIDGCTVHTYNDGDLVACFDENVSESVVTEIAKRMPLRAVFRDASFANSADKINVFEIFKRYMPESANEITKRVKVI